MLSERCSLQQVLSENKCLSSDLSVRVENAFPGWLVAAVVLVRVVDIFRHLMGE